MNMKKLKKRQKKELRKLKKKHKKQQRKLRDKLEYQEYIKYGCGVSETSNSSKKEEKLNETDMHYVYW